MTNCVQRNLYTVYNIIILSFIWYQKTVLLCSDLTSSVASFFTYTLSNSSSTHILLNYRRGWLQRISPPPNCRVGYISSIPPRMYTHVSVDGKKKLVVWVRVVYLAQSLSYVHPCQSYISLPCTNPILHSPLWWKQRKVRVKAFGVIPKRKDRQWRRKNGKDSEARTIHGKN